MGFLSKVGGAIAKPFYKAGAGGAKALGFGDKGQATAGGLFSGFMLGGGTSLGGSIGAAAARSTYDYNKAMEKANAMSGAVPRPEYYGYDPMLRKNMTLPGQLQVNPNTEAMGALRDQAFQEGPSPWAQMMNQKQNDRYTQSVGNLGQQAQTAVNNMQGAMARTGGLSGGAASRINEQMDRQKMFSMQGLGAEKQAGLQDIGLQDEAQKQATLSQLPGLELASLKPEQFNIQQVLQEKANQEEAMMQKYKTEMGGFARQKTAGALGSSPDYGPLNFFYR